MGSADGSAADSYVFPNPWRPHGPKAGDGAGQSGTEAGGMTFTNLPSECTIKIYSLSGGLVRQIRHSDIGSQAGQGQEIWDGKTAHGDTAASGVYFWRVESSVDGKNGKLMIIR
jgi:flagellar hook assembly protein FlgD